MKSPRKGPPILKCPVHRRGSHGGDVLPGGFCAFGRCSSSRQLAGQRWAGARGKNGWMTKHHKNHGILSGIFEEGYGFYGTDEVLTF